MHLPGGGWIARGDAGHESDASSLTAAWRDSGEPAAIAVANVAGAAAQLTLEAALRVLDAPCVWVRASKRGFGVENSYREPERLGPDRWAALIAARARVRGASLVVMAGTATTIDRLDGDGRFEGGLILPGVNLMKSALARETAGLPLSAGRWSESPDCTEDAIETGCLEAQAGAIARQFARLSPDAICLLSGGAAAAIAPLLPFPVTRVDNLVLDGLALIAGEAVRGAVAEPARS